MVGLGNLKFQAYLLDIALAVIQTGMVFCANVSISIHAQITFFVLTELLLFAFWSLFLKTWYLQIMLVSIINVRSNSSFSENGKLQAEKQSRVRALLITNVSYLLLHFSYCCLIYKLYTYTHYRYIYIYMLIIKARLDGAFGSLVW